MNPLVVNLRHLAKHDLDLQGQMLPEVLEINGLDRLITVKQPVRYRLEVQKMDKSLLVRGSLSVHLECQCARCLRPFTMDLNLDQFAASLALEGEDAVPVDGDFVDLTPQLREDIVLAFPQHPLCEPGCAGLKEPPASGPDAQPGQESQMTSSAWAPLNKLKL